MLKFKAMAIDALEMLDLNSFVVMLAEHTDGSGIRLEIQRALLFDEQDRRLEQDTYCLCNEWGAVCYGGVVSWHLTKNELTLVLEARAAEALGVKEGFLIEFEVDVETRDRLKNGLHKVLDSPAD